MSTATRARPGAVIAAAAAALALAVAVVAIVLLRDGAAPDRRARACVYSAHRLSQLRRFGALTGAPVDCAVVFNDAAPDWAAWERPWFTTTADPDLAWAAWARAPGQGRRLIVTQNLFPGMLNKADWLTPGARGAYAGHARNLARSLIAAGLGHATIRLAHEANGTWYPDSIGATAAQQRLWRQFWRRTVLAMRSVPGAGFRFDWCTTPAGRAVALASYYPGDDVVDVVGIDTYDSVARPGADRWRSVSHAPGGLASVLAFARAHGKPVSIPEWGIAPAGTAAAAGDDPAYVRGIARVVRNENVDYEAYFFAREWGVQLTTAPQSLAVLRGLTKALRR